MIWQDVLVHKPLGNDEIALGLAHAFHIRPHDVILSEDATSFPDPLHAKVVCTVIRRDAGYRLALFLYTYFCDDYHPDYLSPIKRLAEFCDTECLISDDSPNPYTMQIVYPNGRVALVHLDSQQLNDKDQYHLKSIDPSVSEKLADSP